MFNALKVLETKTIIFLTFAAALLENAAANTCHKTATVHRWVTQNGFHRTLHTRVQIPWNLTSCSLLLEEKFPAGVFVDPDELGRESSSPERERHCNTDQAGQEAIHCTLGLVDVEAFEPGSKPLRAYTYTQPLCQDQIEVTLSLPLHLRYHAANSGALDSDVVLVQPSLLASCPYLPGESARSCPGWSEGPAPCSHCSHEMCDWTHLPFSSVSLLAFTQDDLVTPSPTWANHEMSDMSTGTFNPEAQLELRIPVPVGNSDHGPLVMLTTAMILLLSTFFLLWTIQRSAKKNR